VSTYESTRQAWRDIWERTDVAAELRTRDYARARATRARFLPFLPKNGVVLEAGCGLGLELVGLAEQGYRMVGIDYVEQAVRRVHGFRPSLALAVADVHALPFRDGTLGAYLSFGVLEHFEWGPGPALREAHRVLRDGGVLVATVPSPSLVWRAARLKRRWFRPPPDASPRYYETTYSAGDLERQVVAAGFEPLVCEPIGHSFTLWGCGRPFRAAGYYETSALAEAGGALFARVLPKAMAFATLIVARKTPHPES
jgi:SAM-dependent methyltransferase